MRAVVFRTVGSLLLCATFCVTALGQGKAARLAEPEVKTLTTKDSFPIKITYYASPDEAKAAPVILLHDKDGNRFIWQNGFAEGLQKEGYAVVTVDLRHHGESRMTPLTSGQKPPAVKLKPADYQAMVLEDLPAVKRFLMQEHHDKHLNINKLAVVGPGMGATIAAMFTYNDAVALPYSDAPDLASRTPRGQDVRGLALISPTKVPGLPISAPLKQLSAPLHNVAYLIISSKLDNSDKRESADVYKILTTYPETRERVNRYEYNTKLTSTAMLGKGLELESTLSKFLSKYCKNAPTEWRVRRSRIEEAGN